MRSLFLTVPCFLLALFTGQQAGKNQPVFRAPVSESAPHSKLYVFAIDIWNRDKQADVEAPGNWRFLGDFGDIPQCGPGNLQACQLVVDERDTEVCKDGERQLKPCVQICALLNKKAGVWFITDYTPTGRYSYKILNEEDETKEEDIPVLIVSLR